MKIFKISPRLWLVALILAALLGGCNKKKPHRAARRIMLPSRSTIISDVTGIIFLNILRMQKHCVT